MYMRSTNQPLTPPNKVEENTKEKNSETQKLINDRLQKCSHKSMDVSMSKTAYPEDTINESTVISQRIVGHCETVHSPQDGYAY